MASVGATEIDPALTAALGYAVPSTDPFDRLTDLDAESAADLWTTPGLIADDRFSGVLESREAMVQGLKQSYPLYRQLGLASVGYDLLGEDRAAGGDPPERWLCVEPVVLAAGDAPQRAPARRATSCTHNLGLAQAEASAPSRSATAMCAPRPCRATISTRLRSTWTVS